MSLLIYDGALSPQVVRWCLHAMESYPCPVEFSALPDTSALPTHTWQEESDYTDHYVTRSSQRYATVWKNASGGPAEGIFLFCATEAEKRIAIEHNRDILVNDKPFRTGL